MPQVGFDRFIEISDERSGRGRAESMVVVESQARQRLQAELAEAKAAVERLAKSSARNL